MKEEEEKKKTGRRRKKILHSSFDPTLRQSSWIHPFVSGIDNTAEGRGGGGGKGKKKKGKGGKKKKPSRWTPRQVLA